MKFLQVFVISMAVAATTAVPLFQGYVNPSLYSTGAVPALARIENVETVLDLTSKYLAQIKAYIPADALPVAIPTESGALPSTYLGNIPALARIENVEAVLDLTSKYLAQIKPYIPANALPAAIPAAAVPLTYEAQLIDTSCKNSLGLSVPCAARRKRSPQGAVAAPIVYNTYTNSIPALARIENVEAVLDLTSKYLAQIKPYIPADALSVAIPTASGALPSTYLGNIPALARIENVETVLDLTSKYLAQIKPYIPSASLPVVPPPVANVPVVISQEPISGATISGF